MFGMMADFGKLFYYSLNKTEEHKEVQVQLVLNFTKFMEVKPSSAMSTALEQSTRAASHPVIINYQQLSEASGIWNSKDFL